MIDKKVKYTVLEEGKSTEFHGIIYDKFRGQIYYNAEIKDLYLIKSDNGSVHTVSPNDITSIIS